jgi:hypothetical protein
MRHPVRRLALVVVLLSVGCASSPRKPAGQLAAYGLKIAHAVDGVQSSIGAIAQAPVVPALKEQAAKALEQIDKVNQQGTQLAPILRAIDAATTPAEVTGDIAKARALLDGMAPLVAQALGPLGDSPEFAEAVKAARALLTLIGTVQFELGQQAVTR